MIRCADTGHRIEGVVELQRVVTRQDQRRQCHVFLYRHILHIALRIAAVRIPDFHIPAKGAVDRMFQRIFDLCAASYILDGRQRLLAVKVDIQRRRRQLLLLGRDAEIRKGNGKGLLAVDAVDIADVLFILGIVIIQRR